MVNVRQKLVIKDRFSWATAQLFSFINFEDADFQSTTNTTLISSFNMYSNCWFI